MAVAADLADPAGAMHPIHPPWKQALARRVVMEASRLVYGNKEPGIRAPALIGVAAHRNPGTWGDFHFGYGGQYGNVCNAGGWMCFGVQLTFDMPVVLKGGSTQQLWDGFTSGFEVVDSTGKLVQPMALTGLVEGRNNTVQLNVTYVQATPPAVLRYAWRDYPTMQLFNAAGRPVEPFYMPINVTV